MAPRKPFSSKSFHVSPSRAPTSEWKQVEAKICMRPNAHPAGWNKPQDGTRSKRRLVRRARFGFRMCIRIRDRMSMAWKRGFSRVEYVSKTTRVTKFKHALYRFKHVKFGCGRAIQLQSRASQVALVGPWWCKLGKPRSADVIWPLYFSPFAPLTSSLLVIWPP
jgi:hypothetical protein